MIFSSEEEIEAPSSLYPLPLYNENDLIDDESKDILKSDEESRSKKKKRKR